IASSQGSRSSSVSGLPEAIFSILAREWKSSPSAYGTPNRSASRPPIVVLPVPVTPITTTTRVPVMCPSCPGRGWAREPARTTERTFLDHRRKTERRQPQPADAARTRHRQLPAHLLLSFWSAHSCRRACRCRARRDARCAVGSVERAGALHRPVPQCCLGSVCRPALHHEHGAVSERDRALVQSVGLPVGSAGA